MLLSLTSCASPAAQVTRAIERTEALESYHAVMEMAFEVEVMGVSTTMEMEMDIQAQKISDEVTYTAAKVKAKVGGIGDSIYEMYNDGEWLYVVFEDQGFKTKLDKGDDEYDYAGDVADMMQDLPKDMFEGIEIEKGEDGSRTVKLEIAGETFESLFEDVLKDVSNSVDNSATDVKVGNATVTIVIKDRYINNYDMAFPLTMKISAMGQSVEVEANVKAALEFKEPGKDVTVTFPEGYKDYTTVDADNLPI
jgi:hypothetical protein